MMYLWADTTIENDLYYFAANRNINKRSFGSRNFNEVINRYYSKGLCLNYSPERFDAPILPWEFLE